MKHLLLLFAIFSFINLQAQDFFLRAPDNNISATIKVGNEIQYSVKYRDVEYIKPSSISLKLSDGRVLGLKGRVLKSNMQSVSRIVKSLYGISGEIKENYNQLTVQFKEGYAVELRMYNEGFAWRFVTALKGDITVQEEQAEYNFGGNYKTWFHPALSESDYRIQMLSDKDSMPNYSSMPVLVKLDNNVSILLHESDVLDYPCMSLKSAGNNTLSGEHKKVPTKTEPGGHANFNLIVKETENYIAKTRGARNFPWRIIAFTNNDKDILNNQLVYLLAGESKIKETSWIKPGKVAWDWWNALNLTGVPFKTGFNTQTYKYYIDFAARNGIEYVNLDEGWSDQFDLMKVTDKLDMAEVVRYAKSKGVGLFLWCVWWTIDKQMTQALDQFEKWGIAGIKVDFMDRDDQIVVNFHERLLKEAAKRKILVNYHGAYHPTGMQRTYPNNINVEGVKGLEWNKFHEGGASPVTAVTIPFIRMFAGSMDYTPGAMNNYNQKEWKQITDRPMSQGTRCHQLAMFVVYHAPLQMMSDAPTAYEKEPEYLKFLSQIPVSWDETYPLQSKVGEYVNVARRKGGTWYMGGMTNWDAREMKLKLDFLDSDKTYIAEIYEDGVNADRVGSDYLTKKQSVKKGEAIDIKMAPGGGYAMKITEMKPMTKMSNKSNEQYNVVMFGNSLIELGGSWNDKLNRTDVKNSGRGGFTTSHFVWLLNDNVIKYNPRVCFLEGGINDMGVGIPLERIKKNYQSMVKTLLSKNIETVLLGVLYVNQENDEDNVIKAKMIDELNPFLQRLAKEKDILYLDLNPYLSVNKRLRKEYTTDGIHLTAKAYEIFSQEVNKVLEEMQF